jgi:hypothetical protein
MCRRPQLKVNFYSYRLLLTKQCLLYKYGCCLAFPDNIISVATALPTIVEDLSGGNEYSWVGRQVAPLTHCFTS